MINCTNCKIYKIEAIDAVESDGDIYIGSTTKQYLSQRMDCHRRDYVQWRKENSKVSRMTSFDIFDKYCKENRPIIFHVNSKMS